jgi:hypothetical protein
LDDQDVDLEELIHKPLPSIPHDVSFTVHWLAIEGVQPRIIQNPTPHELLVQESKVLDVPVDKDAPKVKEILTKVYRVNLLILRNCSCIMNILSQIL